MCTLAVAAFAVDFPGWKPKDASTVQPYYEEAVKNKNFHGVSTALYLMDFAKNGVPTTFDAYKAMIEKNVDIAAKTLGITDETMIKGVKASTITQSACCRNEFCKEAYVYGMANNREEYCMYFMLHRNVGMDDAQVYKTCKDMLMTKNLNSRYASTALDKMIESSLKADIDNATLKADLQKLNRKFSLMLIKDKAKWEPIVAKIRTTLETL